MTKGYQEAGCVMWPLQHTPKAYNRCGDNPPRNSVMPGCLQVRRLKKVQKLGGAMMVNARRQSQGLSPAPSFQHAGSIAGSPALPFNLDPTVEAEGVDDDLAEDEAFVMEEQAHM